MPRIDRYEVVQRLARGGMAEVFLAYMDDAGARVPVVLKRILPEAASDKDVVLMLIDEARITVQLSHPGIARLIDLGRTGKTLYLVVEHVDGRDLRKILDALKERGEKLSPLLLAHVVQRAAEAVDSAHRQRGADGRPLNVVHRDLSPANLMVAFDGSVKVIDFGIARAADRATKTAAGVVKGKFRYMAPEQGFGEEADHRADVYSLGVILYEGLAGHPVLPKLGDAQVISEAFQGRIPSLSKLGVRTEDVLERAVSKAMSPNPEFRQSSAAELARELSTCVAALGGAAAAKAELVALLQRLFPDGPGAVAKAIASA